MMSGGGAIGMSFLWVDADNLGAVQSPVVDIEQGFSNGMFREDGFDGWQDLSFLWQVVHNQDPAANFWSLALQASLSTRIYLLTGDDPMPMRFSLFGGEFQKGHPQACISGSVVLEDESIGHATSGTKLFERQCTGGEMMPDVFEMTLLPDGVYRLSVDTTTTSPFQWNKASGMLTPLDPGPGESFGRLAYDVTFTPEPATLGLLAGGGVAMLWRRRRAAD